MLEEEDEKRYFLIKDCCEFMYIIHYIVEENICRYYLQAFESHLGQDDV